MDKKTADIATRARGGDSQAFGELYSLFSSELYRYALYYLGNREAAQDAVQDAMLEAFRCIASLKKSESAKAWLFAILARTCKHSLREKYTLRTVDLEQCIDVGIGMDESVLHSLELAHMLGSLPPEEREVILLSLVCGYNSKEISKLLDCTAGTVRSRLSRSLAKMRKGEMQKEIDRV